MKRILIVNCLILLIAGLAFSQEQSSFLQQNAGVGVNTTYDEFNPVISPDGKTLYFVRANHPDNKYGAFDSQDIWYSELQNDVWSKATRVPEFNIGRYNALLGFINDGNTVLLNGVYNKNGTFWKRRGLSISTRVGGTWNPPAKIKIRNLKHINDGSSGGAFMSNDGKVMFMSMHRWYNSNKSDIFVSDKKENGKWRKPKKVHLLSSGGTEGAPFLSADNQTMYVSSDDAMKGQFDIYKSKRLDDGWHEWAEPVKLSDTINSSGWESYYKTNPQGSHAWFSSTHKSLGGIDVFKVKLFEENPFVIVSGEVLNSKTGLPLKKIFTIMVNGQPADSVSVNQDSATYTMTLPLRKKYRALASVKNYTSIMADIDVSNIREFTKLKKDLTVTPIPYVHVTGKLLIRASGQVVPASANAKILIDNAESDSIKFDSKTGTYSLNINHGQKYALLAKATKHESAPATLDLSGIDEFQEINLDLYLETEKLVTVTGLVSDKKTGKGFKPASKVNVVFTGASTFAASLDTITSRYEIHLQPGSSFAISASAPNCVPVYEAVDLSTIERGSTITKDLVLATVEVGQAVRLNNIFFESGKAVLKKESFPELDRVYDFLSQNEAIKIELGGHTDNVGNAAFNMGLSKSRAEAVATYIVKKGIAKDRLQSKGYGMTKPVTSNATKAGQAQNRRVEFVILGK